ncbi:TetR/AcrR family transcriptional regulator [Nocardia sp. NPDC050697]|uniref:TetR/AcrR family transcriptional regulator n=1 Tax=Nocardia sp. NPDC050697 TaxID=3155158 RepID=UPI0033C75839
MADEGAKGLSHPKVDRYAQVPNGSTSFYFRTRSALLAAVAQRVAELDLVDLLTVTGPVETDAVFASPDASRLATMVMLSVAEPRLTRTKARFELLFQANRDPALAAIFEHNSALFAELYRREIVGRSRSEPGPELLEQQVAAVMSFVSGVHLRVLAGDRTIGGAAQLDLLLTGIVNGIADAGSLRSRRDRVG